MKRFIMIPVIAAVALFIASGCGKKAQPTVQTTETGLGNPQTTCPVMGSKIDKSLYVDVKGKRVYVCCQECVQAVKANPDKYLDKMASEGISVADVPK
jgi:YHS domain-containing protein